MKLFDLTIEAEKKVGKHTRQDICAWVQAIDPVLEAAGACKIGADHVDYITFDDEGVNIQTSYTMRGYEQTQYMDLPMAILNAENPIQAATRYRLEKALHTARYSLSFAEETVIECQKNIDALVLKISSLDNNTQPCFIED